MKWLFNKSLRILLITNGLILLSGAMIGPIYALFVEEVGGSLLDASFAGGIFALAAGLTTLIAGRYADKIKKEGSILVMGYLLMGVGFLLYTLVDSIEFLFAVQILIGFSEAFYSPAFDKLFSEHVTRRKSGREWAAWESIDYFSAAIGAIIGGFIVTRYGFNTLFVIMSALCFISAFYLSRVYKKAL